MNLRVRAPGANARVVRLLAAGGVLALAGEAVALGESASAAPSSAASSSAAPSSVAPSSVEAPSAEAPLRSLRVVDLTPPARPTGARRKPYRLSLSLAIVGGSGWSVEEIRDAVEAATAILGQCGVHAVRVVLHEFDAPSSYRVLWTPVSRAFARRAALPRPAVFFVSDTRNAPAFDAEAVGRSNARTRPEMRDTVWVVAGARDLPVVIAHELFHVLADSGAHSERPGNLMRDRTDPRSVALDPEQCRAMVVNARAHGLLKASGR